MNTSVQGLFYLLTENFYKNTLYIDYPILFNLSFNFYHIYLVLVYYKSPNKIHITYQILSIHF